MKHKILFIFTIIFINDILLARSVYRPLNNSTPKIVTNWIDGQEKFELSSKYLEENAILKQFDYNFFMSHMLPQEKIYYRIDKTKSVEGRKLYQIAQNLLDNLKTQNKNLKDFTILKDRDFNWNTLSGYLILKYKNYPFVLKLSIETPATFVKPYSKGWQSVCFFTMGGGINHYLIGFNRIKNLEEINKHIATDTRWSSQIDTPRKWFWMPKNNKWFELTAINLGNGQKTIKLPSVYGIIADAINSDKTLSLFNKDNRKLAIELSHFLGNRIDPHIDNFMIEKETGKIVIIDTEPFYIKVGLKKPLVFDSYPSWYAQLTTKCLADNFGRSKKYRTNK